MQRTSGDSSGSQGMRALWRVVAAATPKLGLVVLLAVVGLAMAGQDRYEYDPAGRLIRHVDSANRVIDYTHDPAGNILAVTPNTAAAVLPVVNGMSPNVIRRGAAPTITLTGQRLQTGTWDSNNRLTQITQPGLTASFSYDAFGRRIQSSITKGGSTSTVQYLYEGLQSLGEIRDGKLSHRLLTGLSLDETIARMAINQSGSKDAATSRVYMTDALNSVIAQLNDDNQASLANSYGYSPYGQSEVIGVDATGNPVQYTSRENDGTGLLYHRARYRDPVLGGWLSEDPAGFVDGFNKRGYVQGDPISLADPTGEFAQVIVGGVIGGISGLVGALNDPCASAGSIAQAVAMGTILGGVSAAVPVGGPLAAAAVRNALAGFGGNSAGQLVTGGVNNYNAGQAVAQGVVGGLSGGYGNALGLATGVNMVRNGATSASAISTSLGVGTTGAIGMGASINMMLPSRLGGLNPAGGISTCGCAR